jgi:hypothetical protein
MMPRWKLGLVDLLQDQVIDVTLRTLKNGEPMWLKR